MVTGRRVGRALLMVIGLYLLGTTIHGYITSQHAGFFPAIRLLLGAALLAAAYFIHPAISAGQMSTGGGGPRAEPQQDQATPGSLPRAWKDRIQWTAMPLAFLLVIMGGWCLRKPVALVWPGLLLTAAGLVLLSKSLRREQIDLRRKAPETVSGAGETSDLGVHWKMATVALGLSTTALMALSENRFTLTGTTLWASGVALWVGAVWKGPVRPSFRKPAAILVHWAREGIRICLEPKHLLMLGMVATVVIFRFWSFDSVPGEMTSEHVEDLLVVNRIINQGARPIFEPSLGGRETLGFYVTALVVHFFRAGLTYGTLKIIGALEGLLALFFIFLLAREITDDKVGGMLAMFTAGIAWWPNMLSRLGTGVTLAACFSSLALWLMIRALKRNSRNMALLSGLVSGIGLYCWTAMWIVPVACAMALLLYGLSERGHDSKRRAILYWLVSTVTALLVCVPMLRYHLDHREELALRISRCFYEGPGSGASLSVIRLVRNEWNSLRMFHWSSDSAWIASPAGQPALDWIMAALLVLGAAVLVFRYRRFHDWPDLFLLLSLPVLLLPSTLVLVFEGRENPSLQRSGAAVPVVFIVISLALLVLLEVWRRSKEHRVTSYFGWILTAVVLSGSALANWRILFGDYAQSYSMAAQNASGIGTVIRNFAQSVGSYDSAFVKSYPHWADVRAVGIYAGKLGWEQSICDTCIFRDARAMKNDPRPKLFIVHPQDQTFVTELRETFPEGSLSNFGAPEPRHDFLIFFVSGQPGTRERQGLRP